MQTVLNLASVAGIRLAPVFFVSGTLFAGSEAVREEQFLLCASRVVNKQVTRDALSVKRSRLAYLNRSCPKSQSELSTVLDEWKLVLVDGGYAAVVVSEDVRKRATWQTLRLKTKNYTWDTIPGSRNPTEMEQQMISDVILNRVPLPPLVVPHKASDGGEFLSVDIEIWMDVHRLSIGRGEETAAVIYGQNNGVRRMVVGRLDDEGFAMAWYSPLFSGRYVRLGYVDFDNDGNKEFGIGGTLGSRLEFVTLAVLDSEGTELTRVAKTCPKDFGYTRTYGLCPLLAADFEFVDRIGGGKDILAIRKRLDGNDLSRERVIRYSLRDGVFEPVTDP